MTRPLFISLLLLAGLTSAALSSDASAQSGDSIRIIAIDAVTAGNTATSLGPLNACLHTELGSTITVDLVVDAVPGPPTTNGIIGFELDVDYPTDILTLTAHDYEFLLGANGTFQLFEGLGDSTPDSDGTFHISVADLATNDPSAGSNVEEGPGVLARLTFATKSIGLATILPAYEPPNVYPTILNNQNLPTDIENIAGAQIAVGLDCLVPPEASPVPQPILPFDEAVATPTRTLPPNATQTPDAGASATSSVGASRSSSPRSSGAPAGDGPSPVSGRDGESGTSTGTVIALVALTIAGSILIGAGSFFLYRRRRT